MGGIMQAGLWIDGEQNDVESCKQVLSFALKHGWNDEESVRLSQVTSAELRSDESGWIAVNILVAATDATEYLRKKCKRPGYVGWNEYGFGLWVQDD
jgi:hypothetical protein